MSRAVFNALMSAAGNGGGQGWDITKAKYTGKAVDTSASGYSGLFFDEGGTRMLVVVGGKIRSYLLGTAWDVSTASFVTEAAQNVIESNKSLIGSMECVWLSPDGEQAAVLSGFSSLTARGLLSTPWDISTLRLLYSDYGSFCAVKGYSVPNGINGENGLFMSPDGLNLYLIGTSAVIAQTSLNTAWDITVQTDAGKRLSAVAEAENAARGLYISPDGLHLFITGQRKVYRYDLSTPWDVSTGSYSGQFFDCAEAASGAITAVWFSPDGLTMFVVDYYGEVMQYALG